jgi:putative transferase (TIGR04331 family)
MFLALTALSEFWKKDGDVLLLGPWCAPHRSHRQLETLQWRMLPSPWAVPGRLDDACVYAETVYRRLLAHLAVRLNVACGVDESLAYWRILVGPWLQYFVHAVYDRYVHLRDALTYSDLRTTVLDPTCFRTPRTTKEAVAWLSQDDLYNWQLFSELLEHLEDAPVRDSCRVVTPMTGRTQSTGPRSLIGRQARWVRDRTLRMMSVRQPACWITWVTMPRLSQLQLAVRSRLRIIPVSLPDLLSTAQPEAISDHRRGSLSDFDATDLFELACARMLAQHLPTAYLEGFAANRRRIQQHYPRTPAVLVSETGWYANETCKYLAGQALGRGARLVTVQHGAVYGLAKVAAIEQLEREVGHTFFVWGWAGTEPSLRNVPHPIVSRRVKRRRRGDGVLFVLHIGERYLVRLGPAPAGSLCTALWQWQARFVGSLPGAIRRQLVVRPPLDDMGQNVCERLCEQFAELHVDSRTSFKQSVASSSLVVFERLGTGALESLSFNVPTVLFWDSNVWRFHDRAVPRLDALRRAGILWDSPESAAAHVAAVSADPSAWWNRDAVQDARRAFVESFSLARRDWLRGWVQALDDELARTTG